MQPGMLIKPEKVKHRTMIGGQAVIEGVMMRGPKSASLSVRTPDGSIVTEMLPAGSIRDRSVFLRLPLVRGVVNFVEMLIFGYKTLMRSAELAGLEDDESGKDESSKGAGILMSLSTLIGIVLAVGLFVVLPAYTVKAASLALPLGPFKTVTEGLIRIAVFLVYLILISRMKDMKRVFEYHGAEHKTIYCYEHGLELTPENARGQSRFHPRCGTSFLLIVMVVGILVFSFVTWNNLPVRIALHLVLLPLVVGISFEIIKFAGRHDTSAMRFVLAPGLWLQRLTTREPDDSQLEVAIASMKAVLTDDRSEDAW